MLGFVSLGTNDLKAAGGFYDAVFNVLGAKRSQEGERISMWSSKSGTGSIAVITPFDKNPATAGNGTMLSLDAGDSQNVKAVHAKAIEMGGTDEGAPGPRGTGDFYSGYFRDLDGNKLVAFCRQEIK
jgi:predicted lactoylglutathione lyase